MLVYCVVKLVPIPIDSDHLPKGFESFVMKEGTGINYINLNCIESIHVKEQEAEEEVAKLNERTTFNHVVVVRQLLGARNYTIRMNLGELDITAE